MIQALPRKQRSRLIGLISVCAWIFLPVGCAGETKQNPDSLANQCTSLIEGPIVELLPTSADGVVIAGANQPAIQSGSDIRYSPDLIKASDLDTSVLLPQLVDVVLNPNNIVVLYDENKLAEYGTSLGKAKSKGFVPDKDLKFLAATDDALFAASDHKIWKMSADLSSCTVFAESRLRIRSLTCDKDNIYYLADEPGIVNLVKTSATSGDMSSSFTLSHELIYGASLASDQVYLMGSKNLHIVDSRTLTLKQSIKLSTGGSELFAVSPDGRYVVGGGGHRLQLIDIERQVDKSRVLDEIRNDISKSITAIALRTEDQKVLIGFMNGWMCEYDLTSFIETMP